MRKFGGKKKDRIRPLKQLRSQRFIGDCKQARLVYKALSILVITKFKGPWRTNLGIPIIVWSKL